MKTNNNNNKGSILQAGVLCPEGKKLGLQRPWNVRPLSLLCARCLHTCPPQPYPAWKPEALCLHFKEEEDYSLHRCCYLPPNPIPAPRCSRNASSPPSLPPGCHRSTLGLRVCMDQLLVCPGGTCREATFCPMLARGLSLIHIKGKVHERLQKGPNHQRRQNPQLSGQRAHGNMHRRSCWPARPGPRALSLCPSLLARLQICQPLWVWGLWLPSAPPVITCTRGPVSCSQYSTACHFWTPAPTLKKVPAVCFPGPL